MSHEKELLKGLLQEDHASTFLARLPKDERRPQYMTNRLPESPETFTKEEQAAALAIFTPDSPVKDNSK